MLRITRVPGAGVRPALKLEGKLLGPWVDALRDASAAAGGAAGLDLSAVSYVDAAGVRLLKELLARGAEVVACNGLVAQVLHLEVR